jgi:hypothetical protein
MVMETDGEYPPAGGNIRSVPARLYITSRKVANKSQKAMAEMGVV